MKKLLFCLIAIFTLQTGKAQDVHWGLKAGLNAATFSIENQDDVDFKAGLHAGALAHIHITRQWAIQPELFYSGQGAKGISNNNNLKANLHYLNLPVSLQYMFNNGFRLQAGPQVGFLLSANHKLENSDNEADADDLYKNIDVSLPVGIGYLSSSGLGIDLRWAFGLSNINDFGNGNPTVRNQVGQIGLFYMFNHQK